MRKIIKTTKYKPAKFKFIDDSVGNSKLMFVDIDISNGLVADTTSKSTRKAIFRTANMPVEMAGKYKNGLAPLLHRKDSSSEEDIMDILQDMPSLQINNSDSAYSGDGILD